MRHAGENSGLSTCKLRSRTRAATDAAIAIPADATGIFDVAASDSTPYIGIRLPCGWAPALSGALNWDVVIDCAFRTSGSPVISSDAGMPASPRQTGSSGVEVAPLRQVGRA